MVRLAVLIFLFLSSFCRASALTDEVANLQTLSVDDRVERVQALINSMYYKPSSIVTYWKSPETTMETRTGNCADFAVLAFFLLHDSGIPDSRLRLIYAETKEKEKHLVLAIQTHSGYRLLDSASGSSVTSSIQDRTDLRLFLAFNKEHVYRMDNMNEPAAGYYARGIRQWSSVLMREEFKDRNHD